VRLHRIPGTIGFTLVTKKHRYDVMVRRPSNTSRYWRTDIPGYCCQIGFGWLLLNRWIRWNR
jgi:hypothetical protein